MTLLFLFFINITFANESNLGDNYIEIKSPLITRLNYASATEVTSYSFVFKNEIDFFVRPKSLDLDIYVLENNTWTPNIIFERVQMLTQFFFSCEVFFRHININFINNYRFSNTIFEKSENNFFGLFRILEIIENNDKIKLIYLNKFEDNINGIAFPDAVYPKYSSLIGNAYISKDTIKWENVKKNKMDDDFSVEAHELGHILLNRGHVLYGQTNFMAPEATKSRINQEQCTTLRKSRFINKE